MRRYITAVVVTVVLMLALAACGDSRPRVTPPPATLVSAQVTPTDAVVAPVGMTPEVETTATATVSATVTVSPTAPLTVTVEAVVVEGLNIRAGPGIDYPIVGPAPADLRVVVLGRSLDGLWLKIQCPPPVVAAECWIIGGDEYVQLDAAAALAAAPAPPVPPTPALLPTPTATPCIASAPPGWTSVQVASGDTLSALASRYGTSVQALRAANCLPGDAIRAGSSLNVPTGGAAPAAGAVPAAADAAVSDAGVVAGFRVGVAPNDSTPGCFPRAFGAPPATPTLHFLDTFINERDTFQISDLVCIQPRGFTDGQPVQVQVTRIEDGQVQIDALPPTADIIWSYPLRPGYTPGRYEVTATQDALVATDAFTVTRALPPPKIRVLTPSVSPGQPVEVISAGLRPGQRFHIYRLERGEWRLLPNRSFPVPNINSFGESAFFMATTGEDSGKCYLIHTGFPETGDILRSDQRVFTVGVGLLGCQ